MEKSNEVFAVSERLVIRQFGIHDVQPFYQYRSNPEASRFQSWENYTLEDAEAFVSKQMATSPNQPGTWFQYAIALGTSDRLIGDCAIHTIGAEPRIVELGFTLAPEYQGKGYMHEALCALLDYVFGSLNKHKMIAFTDVRNTKSIQLLERLGMRLEGHLLENYMIKGHWVDEYQYAVLQSKWLKKRQ
ncbi:GNAT family N-acetyltransferase [Paenibacillus maysiensis]|uniref:GNAT family N-acetyltransferase n=1 Tax=Paenibacillus maysiensis TaxID=1155954 RepID=UPI000472734D|nr:GNAT family N-acetyltransferase [Paenibacillus maysiensis]